MKEISFLTLHPEGTNVDLTKDEGQIPYTLSKMGIDATIVTSYIDKTTANLKNVPGLNVKHFPLIFNSSITGLVYILLHAKKIDWLNIYFAGRKAYLWSKLYKTINRKGNVYLKLDMDFRSCDLYDTNPNERYVFSKCTQIADIVSSESKAIKERIQKYAKKEIVVIRDGLAENECKPKIDMKRDNTFITVARLGTKQKATDILLEAFAKSASYHNWDLLLVGSVEDDFRPYIDKFFKNHPMLERRVKFVGVITDRNVLYEKYCTSKVFVLPSRWESYGISAVEALNCGCYLLLSDSIPPANEMTNNGKCGCVVEAENIDDLTRNIIDMTKREYDQNEINEMVKYAGEEFSWERICKKLLVEMRRVSKKGDI